MTPSEWQRVAELLDEAIEQAGLAYEFNPGSYTYSALQSCLRARAIIPFEREGKP